MKRKNKRKVKEKNNFLEGLYRNEQIMQNKKEAKNSKKKKKFQKKNQSQQNQYLRMKFVLILENILRYLLH